MQGENAEKRKKIKTLQKNRSKNILTIGRCPLSFGARLKAAHFTMSEEKRKKGLGRPQAELDWNEIGKLLSAACTTTDIAAQLGIDPKTLYDRCEKDLGISYSLFSQKNRSKGDNLLRAVQYKNAMSGNTSMQIWLGKQRLGQSEKNESHVHGTLSDFDHWKKQQEKKKDE